MSTWAQLLGKLIHLTKVTILWINLFDISFLFHMIAVLLHVYPVNKDINIWTLAACLLVFKMQISEIWQQFERSNAKKTMNQRKMPLNRFENV